MRVTFTLPVRSFSINSMHYATKRVKTTDAREWEATIIHYLSVPSIQMQLELLRTHFNKKIHGWEVSIIAYYPESELYTKTGELSSKVHDLSNIEKPLIDLIFLPKYYNQDYPYGCKNLNCDDRYIKRLHSEKCASDKSSLEVSLSIVPK